MEKEISPLRQGIILVYLSIAAHLYILWFISRTIDPELSRWLARPKAQNEAVSIENIIVRTKTESARIPEKGLISDKPNLDSAPESGEKRYNLPAPDDDSRPSSGGGGPGAGSEAPEGTTGTAPRGGQAGRAPAPPGNIYTAYYTPEHEVDVTMDSSGRVSLATVPREYAEYFLEMQKKIGGKWMEFAPHPLSGAAIPRGEVEVTFGVSSEGWVKNPSVTRSYGYRTVDLSCFYAVYYAGEFGPLPKAIDKPGGIVVRFRFIYLSPFVAPAPYQPAP